MDFRGSCCTCGLSCMSPWSDGWHAVRTGVLQPVPVSRWWEGISTENVILCLKKEKDVFYDRETDVIFNVELRIFKIDFLDRWPDSGETDEALTEKSTRVHGEDARELCCRAVSSRIGDLIPTWVAIIWTLPCCSVKLLTTLFYKNDSD